MSTGLMAMRDGWLDAVSTVGSGAAPPLALTTSGASLTTAMTGYEVQTTYTPSLYHYCYPSWGYPVHVTSPSRPIKLTLREVERLRDAAQADPKLQCILAKFTDQIEVAVSFED